MKTYNEIVDNVEKLEQGQSQSSADIDNLKTRVSATEGSIEDLVEFIGQASETVEQLATAVGRVAENTTGISYNTGEVKTTVEHDLDVQGDLTVNGNPVGSALLYQHNICIRYVGNLNDYWYINVTIMNNSSTPFTKATLQNYLETNNFTGYNSLKATGSRVANTTVIFVVVGLVYNQYYGIVPSMFNVATGEVVANTSINSSASYTDTVVQES